MTGGRKNSLLTGRHLQQNQAGKWTSSYITLYRTWTFSSDLSASVLESIGISILPTDIWHTAARDQTQQMTWATATPSVVAAISCSASHRTQNQVICKIFSTRFSTNLSVQLERGACRPAVTKRSASCLRLTKDPECYGITEYKQNSCCASHTVQDCYCNNTSSAG